MSEMTSNRALEIAGDAEQLVADGDATKEQLEAAVLELSGVVKQAVEAITSYQQQLAEADLLFALMQLGLGINPGVKADAEPVVIEMPGDGTIH